MKKTSSQASNSINKRKIVLKPTVQTRNLTKDPGNSHNKELEVISPLSPPNNSGGTESNPRLVPNAKLTKKIPGTTSTGAGGNRRSDDMLKAKSDIKMQTLQTPQTKRNALAESKLSNNSASSKPKPGTIKRRVDMSEPRRQYYKTTDSTVGKIRKNVGQSQPSAAVEKSMAEDAALNLSSIDRGSDGLTRQEMSGPDPVHNLNEGIQFLQKNLKALEGKYKDLAKFYGNEKTHGKEESSGYSRKDTNQKRATILNELTEQHAAITMAKNMSEQALQDLSQAMNQVSVLVLGADHQLYTSLTQAKESLSGQLNQLDKIAGVSQSLAAKVQEEQSSVLEALFHNKHDFHMQLEEQKQSSQRQLQQMEKTMTELRMQNADLRSKIESSAKDIKSKQNSNLQASQKVQELQSLLQAKEQDLISLADSTKNFLVSLRQVQKSVQRGGSESLIQDKAQFNQSKRDLEHLLSKVSGSEHISIDVEESGELQKLRRELSDIQTQHQQAVGQHCVTLRNVKKELQRLDQHNQRRGADIGKTVLELQKRIGDAVIKQKQRKPLVSLTLAWCVCVVRSVIATLKTQCHLAAKALQGKDKEISQLSQRLAHQTSQTAQLQSQTDALKMELQKQVKSATSEQLVQSQQLLQEAENTNGKLQAECALAKAELSQQLQHNLKLKSDHKQALATMQSDYESKLESRQQHLTQTLDKLKAAHAFELDQLKQQLDKTHSNLYEEQRKKHYSQEQLERLLEQDQSKVQEQLVKLQTEVDSLQTQLGQKQHEIERIQKESQAQLAELTSQLSEQLQQQQDTHSKQMELLKQSHKLDLQQAQQTQHSQQDSQASQIVQLQNQLFQQSQTHKLLQAQHTSTIAELTHEATLAQSKQSDVEQQLAQCTHSLQEEQVRSADLEQTLEHNLGLTQQLKDSLQKALEKNKLYKRDCHEMKIEKAELEKNLTHHKENKKHMQALCHQWRSQVQEVGRQWLHLKADVEKQWELERGAYAEFFQFVCLQVSKLPKTSSHEQLLKSDTAHLQTQLSEVQLALQRQTDEISRLQQQLQESQEELMAKNELIEEANNFIVEYTEEKHELKAKFKVLVGGLLCDQTVSSYKSTDQVDLDKCFELIEQTLLDRSVRAGEGKELQSRLLNELAQVSPGTDVLLAKKQVVEQLANTQELAKILNQVQVSKLMAKVTAKLEQAKSVITFQKEQLLQLNQAVSQSKIRESALRDQLQTTKSQLQTENEDIVMRLAQAEVELEQVQEQLKVAQDCLRQQATDQQELKAQVLRLNQEKLDLQTEIDLAQKPNESLLSDQNIKELQEENAQLLQRLLKVQSQKAQDFTVDAAEFEPKLNALRKQLITFMTTMRQEVQQQLQSEVQEVKIAYQESRITQHNVLRKVSQSWNTDLQLCHGLEINQKSYYLVQSQQNEFSLLPLDSLTEDEIMYIRSFSEVEGQVFQMSEDHTMIKDLASDLLELRQDYVQYANAHTAECQERTEVALQDEVEYLIGENKDLQLKLKEVCLVNAQLKQQVASHLMQDVTDHDMRDVLEKEEPNSFMTDHDSFIVEALNSDSRHLTNKNDVSCASEQTTMQHVKATLQMYLAKVPQTDAKNEELLPIIYSMMSFTQQEISDLTKQRQQLLVKPQPMLRPNSAQALSTQHHNSQEDQSVKSENAVKKGLIGFFNKAVKNSDSGKQIKAPSPVRK